MPRDSKFNQPERHWFANTNGADEEHRYLHQRLRTIWTRSLEYSTNNEHEAAWNSFVHRHLLEEALDKIPSIECKNM